MAVGLDPAIQSDPTATVNEKSAHETRTCRERERERETMHEASSSRPVGVLGIFHDR